MAWARTRFQQALPAGQSASYPAAADSRDDIATFSTEVASTPNATIAAPLSKGYGIWVQHNLTIPDLAKHDLIYLRVTRAGTNALDTYTRTMSLKGSIGRAD